MKKRMNRTLPGYRLVSRAQARLLRKYGEGGTVETVALEVREAAADPSWSEERGSSGRRAQDQRVYHRHYSPRARAKKKSRRRAAKASRRVNRG